MTPPAAGPAEGPAAAAADGPAAAAVVTRRGALRGAAAVAVGLPAAVLSGRVARAAAAAQLASGAVLRPGQRLTSPDGGHWLVLQTDGNVVIYGARGAVWQSATRGVVPNRLAMQPDGNLVLYDTSGHPRWQTGSGGGSGRAGAHLALGNDAVAVVACGAQPLWTSSSGPVPFPAYHPNALRHVGTATQMLVVDGVGPSSSYATLYSWGLTASGVWSQRFGPVAARTGYQGWSLADQRVQNDGTSPAGTFTLTEAYGLAANPGTALPYTRVGAADYRSGDPRDPQTYNVRQPSASASRTWRAGTATSERFADYPTQYQYLVNIDFCTPLPASLHFDAAHQEYVTSAPAPVGRGFAIYLHCSGAGDTAGCVSIPAAQVAAVLRWLTPAGRPRIAMAPGAWLRQI